MSRLGVFVRTRPVKVCNFALFHGTYAKRVPSIRRRGLRAHRAASRTTQPGVWLATTLRHASAHIARRAVEDGCPRSDLRVVRVHLRGDCEAFRPVAGGAKVFFVPRDVPPEAVSGVFRPDPEAAARGRERGKRRVAKGRKPRPKACPPPVLPFWE